MLAAASYAGVHLDIDKDYVHKETNKTSGFTGKFPFGEIPAFEGSDGFLLAETTAIMNYSERSLSFLRPSSFPR